MYSTSGSVRGNINSPYALAKPDKSLEYSEYNGASVEIYSPRDKYLSIYSEGCHIPSYPWSRDQVEKKT